MPRQKKVKLIGLGLPANVLQDFIQLSYSGQTRAPDGYELDKELSNSRVKVYTKNNSKEVIIVHRGSVGLLDWKDNLSYVARGKVKGTKSYELHKAVQEKAISKYGAENIIGVGHSRGGIYLATLQKELPPLKEVISYNKGVGFYNMFDTIPENQTDVRTKNDFVSLLSGLQKRPKKMVEIEATKNPLDLNAAHQPAELEKLGETFIGLKEDEKPMEGSGRAPSPKTLEQLKKMLKTLEGKLEKINKGKVYKTTNKDKVSYDISYTKARIKNHETKGKDLIITKKAKYGNELPAKAKAYKAKAVKPKEVKPEPKKEEPKKEEPKPEPKKEEPKPKPKKKEEFELKERKINLHYIHDEINYNLQKIEYEKKYIEKNFKHIKVCNNYYYKYLDTRNPNRNKNIKEQEEEFAKIENEGIRCFKKLSDFLQNKVKNWKQLIENIEKLLTEDALEWRGHTTHYKAWREEKYPEDFKTLSKAYKDRMTKNFKKITDDELNIIIDIKKFKEEAEAVNNQIKEEELKVDKEIKEPKPEPKKEEPKKEEPKKEEPVTDPKLAKIEEFINDTENYLNKKSTRAFNAFMKKYDDKKIIKSIIGAQRFSDFYPTSQKCLSNYKRYLNNIHSDDIILEPTAGLGSIVLWLLKNNVKSKIIATDFDPNINSYLKESFAGINQVSILDHAKSDYLDMNNDYYKYNPSVIFLNPPFSNKGDKKYYLNFLFKALYDLNESESPITERRLYFISPQLTNSNEKNDQLIDFDKIVMSANKKKEIKNMLNINNEDEWENLMPDQVIKVAKCNDFGGTNVEAVLYLIIKYGNPSPKKEEPKKEEPKPEPKKEEPKPEPPKAPKPKAPKPKAPEPKAPDPLLITYKEEEPIEIPEPIPVKQEIEPLINKLEKKIEEFEKVGREYGAVIYDPSSFIQVVAYIALLMEYEAKCAILGDKGERKTLINSKLRSPTNKEFYEKAEELSGDLLDCIEREDKLIAIPLALRFGSSLDGHANLLIYRPFEKTIERFEPHGAEYGGKDGKEADEVFNKVLTRMFEVEMKPYLKEYTPKFISPDQICPNPRGFQLLEGEVQRLKQEGGGFCGMWTLFVLELIFINPTKPTAEIIQEALAISKADPQYLRNVIRGYVIKTERLLNDYVKKIDANDGFSFAKGRDLRGKQVAFQEKLLELLLSFGGKNSQVKKLQKEITTKNEKKNKYKDLTALLETKSINEINDMMSDVYKSDGFRGRNWTMDSIINNIIRKVEGIGLTDDLQYRNKKRIFDFFNEPIPTIEGGIFGWSDKEKAAKAESKMLREEYYKTHNRQQNANYTFDKTARANWKKEFYAKNTAPKAKEIVEAPKTEEKAEQEVTETEPNMEGSGYRKSYVEEIANPTNPMFAFKSTLSVPMFIEPENEYLIIDEMYGGSAADMLGMNCYDGKCFNPVWEKEKIKRQILSEYKIWYWPWGTPPAGHIRMPWLNAMVEERYKPLYDEFVARRNVNIGLDANASKDDFGRQMFSNLTDALSYVPVLNLPTTIALSAASAVADIKKEPIEPIEPEPIEPDEIDTD